MTIQTAEFDASGRRIKKVVTNSGDFDGTVVFLYDGQKIIETRDGSGNMVQQFIRGTQYIDEVVMVRVAEKGDLYVHQDANWNVIGLTDMGGRLVERYTYSPYGELTVDQETSYGDRDADGDVDSTDKGTPGVTCTGTVSGACRILDLDFDGDYDSTDATKFDALEQGLARHPGRIASSVSQPFGHQGLLFDAELGQYQVRRRQYDPRKRRWLQRDPLATSRFAGLGYLDGMSLLAFVRQNPLRFLDAFGLFGADTSFVFMDPDGTFSGPIADVSISFDKPTEGDPSTTITITIDSRDGTNPVVFQDLGGAGMLILPPGWSGSVTGSTNQNETIHLDITLTNPNDTPPNTMGPGTDFGASGYIEQTNSRGAGRRIGFSYSGTGCGDQCFGCTISAEQGTATGG